MRWNCIKKNLDVLLPVVSALDAEAELKGMSKDSKESLLQFICRFQATMQWYSGDQLNTQRAAHILLRKLPQPLQRRLAAERFDALSVSFIYETAQDYMSWLSISPTGWKESLGDFMDLDSCAIREAESQKGSPAIEEINVAGSLCQLKPVLDRDSIKWRNIDGPRSLMIAWKKLVATSSRFRQESQDFLRRRSPQAPFARWNARAEAEEDDELEEDWEKLDTSDCHGVGQNATWMESEDLRLEAADLSVFSESEDGEWSREEEQEIFHECSSILLNSPTVG